MIIGITGGLGSGKGAVADSFKEKGFRCFSLSDEIREIAKQKGIEITRENLQDLGNKLRDAVGSDVLARFAALRILFNHYDRAVVESIRNPAEVNYLKGNLKDFFLIGVDASAETRYGRVSERAREKDPITWEDFLKTDSRDRGEGEADSGQAVGKCLNLTDYLISNEGNLQDLGVKCNEVYKKITEKCPRPSWDDYFMEIADVVARRATCDRGRSGCVVTKDKQILVTGYVGSPPGEPHCDEVGHQMKTVRHEDEHETQHCVRTTHAEQNAISQAAKLGIPLKGSTIYCKMTPCTVCAKLIVTSGIERVVCKGRYHAGAESEQLFSNRQIPLEYISGEVVQYANQGGEKRG